MAYPRQPWRAALQQASYGGAPFFIEIDSRASGRRNVTHEFPKRNTPWTEDMGRKASRWSLVAYVIGPRYRDAADALERVCNAEGPFTLVHPAMGTVRASCDECVRTERRELGGYALFEMRFSEAGVSPDNASSADTQQQANAAADTSDKTAAAAADASLGSGDPTPSRYSAAVPDGSSSGDPTSSR